MTTQTYPAGKDGHVSQGSPSEWFGGDAYLRIRGTGSSIERRVLLWFPDPVPVGANVVSATLTLRVRTQAFNGQTITVRNVTSSWSSPTWNNQPSTTATSETSSGAITTGVGTDIVIDVTDLISDVAAGQTWYGLRLTLGTDVLRQFNSKEASSGRPTLEVTYTETPISPTDLRPSENRAVDPIRPTFSWGLFGPGEQAEAQVQVDDASDFATPVWDSGSVAQTAQQMTAGADISPGAYWWRVRVKDSSGVTSEWSEPVQFQRIVKGTLAITVPVQDSTIETSTPTVTHTFSGTQTAVEREVYQDGVLRHSEYATGTGTSWDVPPGVITAESVPLRVVVRVWDDDDREATPGDPVYTEAEVDFDFVRGAVSGVTDLTAASSGSPVVTLEWERASAPSFFALRVDDVLISDRLDPADLLVSGTSYRYVYYGASPGEHTFEVAAVILDAGELRESTANPTADHTVAIKGIWLLSESEGLTCVVLGHDAPDTTDAESGDTLFPAGFPIRITEGTRYLSGTARGMLATTSLGGVERDADEWRERFRTIKDADDKRLVMGSDNFPVTLGEAEMSLIPPGIPIRYSFSVEFWESG